MTGTAMDSAMRRLRVDAMTAEVVTALDGAGIESILLKGPSIARWLYEDDSARTYLDTDLLVAPALFDRAEGVLGRLGFRRIVSGAELGEAIPAHTWVHAGSARTTDLHMRLPGAEHDPGLVWAVLREHAVALRVGTADCRALDADARAMHVAIHAAFHGLGSSQQLEDLRRAVARLDEVQWRRAAELAERIGATAAFATGLRLDPAGAPVACALGLPSAASADLRLRAAGAPPMALGIARLARTPGLRAKLGLVAQKALPRPAVMRSWSPIARRRPLGLAAAYAIRPFWLLAHLPRAVRAWRRASAGRP